MRVGESPAMQLTTAASSSPSCLALALAGTCALASLLVALRARTLYAVRNLPGPPYGFLRGALDTIRAPPSFYDERHKFVRRLHELYGPVVKLVLPCGRGVVVCFDNAHDFAAHVFGDTSAFPRRPLSSAALPLGLVALDSNDMWRAHRQAVVSALSLGALRAYARRIAVRAGRLCDMLESGGAGAGGDAGAAAQPRAGESVTVDVYQPLLAVTLDVIGEIGFGLDFGALDALRQPGGARPGGGGKFTRASEGILTGTVQLALLPGWACALLRRLPRGLMPRACAGMHDGLGVYTELARALYADAASRPAPRSRKGSHTGVGDGSGSATAAPASLLEALARAELPFEEARDEIVTLLIAGHETTAATVCWALLLLSRSPAEQARARGEAEAEVPADGSAGLEEASRMHALRNVLYEALRLYPTVPTVSRVAARSSRVGSVSLPAGAAAMLSVAAAARSSELWGADAARFRPSRHDVAEAGPLGSRWCPFGGGPRRCVGARLAELEAVLILAAVLRRFVLAPPADEPAGAEPDETTDVTLGPKRSGLRLRLIRRPPATPGGGASAERAEARQTAAR